VQGVYDSRGMWTPGGNSYGDQRGAPRDIASRIDNLDQRINRGVQQGVLTAGQARAADKELNRIRSYDRSLRNRNGMISQSNEARIQSRLDRLSDSIRTYRQDARYNN
jgi:hypothetical protein